MRKLALVASVLLLGAALAQADVNLISDGGFATDGALINMGSTTWTEATAGIGTWWTSAGGLTVENGQLKSTTASNINLYQVMEGFSLAANQTITLTFDVVAAATGNITIYMMPRFQSDIDDGSANMAGGALASNENSGNYVVTGGTTGTITVNYTLPAAAPTTYGGFATAVEAPYTAMAMRILISGGGGSAMRLDNFSLTPEPTTLSVLGLGALALLRRRR